MGSPLTVEMNGQQVRHLMFDLHEASTGVKTRVAVVMRATGPTFVRTAKRLVPKDTRALERSIGFTVRTKPEPRMRLGSMKRTINPKSRKLAMTYAGYVHDGTSRMKPRRFIDDAITMHTTAQGNFMRGLRKAGVANIGGSTGGARFP